MCKFRSSLHISLAAVTASIAVLAAAEPQPEENTLFEQQEKQPVSLPTVEAPGDPQAAVPSPLPPRPTTRASDQVRMEFGMGGNPGLAPALNISVPLEGETLSLPQCVADAKKGDACK